MKGLWKILVAVAVVHALLATVGILDLGKLVVSWLPTAVYAAATLGVVLTWKQG